MEQLLCDQAKEAADSLAVIDTDHRFTYRDLLAKSSILAADLRKNDLRGEEPIGILAGPGWQQIVAQVAVLKAGCTSTPVDPSIPDTQLYTMFDDVGVRFVLAADDLLGRVSQFNVLPIEKVLDPENAIEEYNQIKIISGQPENYRSHLLHTSGSTGKPNAVQISSKAVLHLAASLPLDIGRGDQVGHLNNPGFDLSLFEIWVTLLRGGTVVHLPNPVVKDPASCADFLKDTGITALILPSSLFTAISVTATSAFRSVRHVVSAGEPPSPQAMQRVLSSDGPPANLWNGYGPTETTCLSTLQRVTLEETQSGQISTGVPIGDTVIYILDEHQKPVIDDEVPGEIYIAGPGLSAGYLNNPEANAQKFIELELPQSHQSEREGLTRFFRTGDLGLWKSSPKRLQYIGRADLQVKHQGFRVELEEIEKSIAANGRVQGVACLHEKLDDGLGSDKLVTFVVPTAGTTIDPREIMEWMQERVPYYKVPDEVKIISEIPQTSRGKVDRDTLSKMRREPQPSTVPGAKGDIGKCPISTIMQILKEMLGISNIHPHDNILDLGLSSIQFARFLGLIKEKMGTLLSIRDLYSKPSIESLVNHLQEANQMNHGPSEILQLEADSHLADDIELIPNWSSEGHIFLTGATGFIGINLLYRLLSMPSMKAIACLTRGSKECSPLDRIKDTLKRYDLWSEAISERMDIVIVLDGDITQPCLGLSQKDYEWLTGWAPAIIHAAAKVNWCNPYGDHFAPNVLGTKNVLQAAVDGRRKTFHYISSIDVWAVTGLILGTEVVVEDGPLKVHLASHPFDTGYAQSQWVADEMVQRMRDKGLEVMIYRPGFVVGDSKTGAGNPDDFFSRMIVGCLQLGYWPQLPSQNMEYVTVDYVCDSILHIASDNRNMGRAYTLSAPDPGLITNMERLCKLINEAGFSLQQIPYPNWLNKLQTWEGLETSPLISLMPLLAEPVLRGATRLQTSKYSPVYDCTNTLKAIASRDDIRFVQLTPDLVNKLIQFWIREGFHSL